MQTDFTRLTFFFFIFILPSFTRYSRSLIRQKISECEMSLLIYSKHGPYKCYLFFILTSVFVLFAIIAKYPPANMEMCNRGMFHVTRINIYELITFPQILFKFKLSIIAFSLFFSLKKKKKMPFVNSRSHTVRVYK